MGIIQKGDPSRKKTIFQIPESSIESGHQLIIQHCGLVIQAKDKIAVIGKNGCGKSTLVNYLIRHLPNRQKQLVYLPQEISAEQSKEILAEIKALSNEQLGEIMTIVRRLGSNPGRLLESKLPSPGELRKLLIALGVLKKPVLMILDEPTNHLDLPSIECLETALKKYEAALLIVSHDRQFLKQTTNIVWSIYKNDNQATIDVLF